MSYNPNEPFSKGAIALMLIIGFCLLALEKCGDFFHDTFGFFLQ